MPELKVGQVWVDRLGNKRTILSLTDVKVKYAIEYATEMYDVDTFNLSKSSWLVQIGPVSKIHKPSMIKQFFESCEK